MNCVFSTGSIHTPSYKSKLHLLNKLKAGVPGLGDLRLIMISSPIVKIFEFVALREPKRKSESRINKAQFGFLPQLGTQVHSSPKQKEEYSRNPPLLSPCLERAVHRL